MTDSEHDPTPQPAGDDATAQFDAAATDPGPRAWSQAGPRGTAQFGATPETAQFDDFQPIAGPPPPGVVATSPAKRNTGKIIAGVAAAVVLLLVIAGVGTELYVRNKTKDCLQSAFSQLTGTTTTVSMSGKPVLLQRISGKVPYVQVDTEDKADAISLHARADGITGLNGTPTAESMSGSGFAPYQRVIAMSQQASGTASSDGAGTNSGGSAPDSGSPMSGLVQGATIQSMTGNAADGTITVDSTVQVAILPVPVTTTLKPVVDNGHIHVEVVDAQAFMFGVPKDYAQGIVDSVSKSMFGQLTDELTVTNLKVTDKGVDFAFDGKDVTLAGDNEMSSGTTCS